MRSVGFEQSLLKDQQGMTLVEVMVAMGLATVLSLGLMQSITFSNRAIKSSTLTTDWNNVLQTARLAYSNPATCAASFATGNPEGIPAFMGSLTSTTSATVNQTLATIGSLTIRGGGAGTSTLLSTTATIGNLRASSIRVIASPNSVSQEVRLGSTLYWLDNVELVIEANKIQGTGTAVLEGGGTTAMTSSFRHNNAVAFSILRRQDNGRITQCYNLFNAAEQACTEMGGNYGTPNPRCHVANFFFGNNTALGPSTSTNGHRIQLWGTHGTRATSDYAIGMDSGTMWFNAGPGGIIQFDTGTTRRARITNTGEFNVLNAANTNSQFRVVPAGGGTTDNTVIFNADSNPLMISRTWKGFPDLATNQAEISNNTTGGDPRLHALMIVGNRVAGLGRRVAVWDRLDVNGYFYVEGDARVTGHLTTRDLTVTGTANLNNLNITCLLYTSDAADE